MIIGISGKIGVGKDTVGTILAIMLNNPQLNNEGVYTFYRKGIKPTVPHKVWQIKKFADKLKDIVCMLINCTREQLEDETFKNTELGEEWWYWKDNESGKIIKHYESNEAMGYYLIKPTPRLLLQLIGTECGRKIIHPNIWVNSLMINYNKNRGIKLQNAHTKVETFDNWIITDVRFPNEVKAIEDRGGIVIRVIRKRDKDLFYSNTHESETALDKHVFDYIIDNNDDIEHLIITLRVLLIRLETTKQL